MTLIQFLRARLDEEADPTTNHTRNCARVLDQRIGSPERHECDCGPRKRLDTEVDAKRRIIEHWISVHGEADDGCDPAEGSGGYGFENHDGHANALSFALVSLATVYADHPDYDPAWRPA